MGFGGFAVLTVKVWASGGKGRVLLELGLGVMILGFWVLVFRATFREGEDRSFSMSKPSTAHGFIHFLMF